MPKTSKPKDKASLTGIQFYEFWVKVANELGTSRLKINPDAKSIHDLFHINSDARRYLIDAIKQTYVQNKCQHLRSSISLEVVLDVLGETAFKLFGDKQDDLLDIELLEEIAWHISYNYWSYLETVQSSVQNDAENKQHSAKIISFPQFKTIKLNRKL